MLSVRLRAMRVGTDIVNERDIDPIEAETREAELHRTHDAVIRIVVIHRERQRFDIAVVRHLIFRNGSQQPADFCRKDIGLARVIAQEVAHTPFRQAETVKRRGVEVADPRVPGDSEGPSASCRVTARYSPPIAAPPRLISVTSSAVLPICRRFILFKSSPRSRAAHRSAAQPRRKSNPARAWRDRPDVSVRDQTILRRSSRVRPPASLSPTSTARDRRCPTDDR